MMTVDDGEKNSDGWYSGGKSNDDGGGSAGSTVRIYRLPLVICHGSKNDDSGGNTMMVVVIRVVVVQAVRVNQQLSLHLRLA